jgi:hypothetical protein
MKNRRQFVYLSLATVSVCVLRPLHGQMAETQVFASGNVAAYDHGGLSETVFERHLGSVFTAYVGKTKVISLRLEKVNHVVAKTVPDRTGKAALPGRPLPAVTAYSLIFDTDGREIPQDSYIVDHGVLGRFTVFLVPGISVSGKKTCIAYFSSMNQG